MVFAMVLASAMWFLFPEGLCRPAPLDFERIQVSTPGFRKKVNKNLGKQKSTTSWHEDGSNNWSFSREIHQKPPKVDTKKSTTSRQPDFTRTPGSRPPEPGFGTRTPGSRGQNQHQHQSPLLQDHPQMHTPPQRTEVHAKVYKKVCKQCTTIMQTLSYQIQAVDKHV